MELRNRNIKFNDKNRPNLYYPFYVNPNNKDENGLMELALEPKDGFVEVLPAKSNGIQTVWRWGKEEKSRKNLNVEIFGKTNRNGGFMIVQKYRKTSKMQRSIWDEKEFVNERGTELIKELFGSSYFDYPKSIFTVKRVLELGSNTESISMDFFSGSATTAHAVMQLNAEDGGNRKFIMVQLPEVCDENSEAFKAGYKNICEIGKERIRRAGEKIKADNPLTTQDLDIGFRVFKVDSSNMNDVYYSAGEYSQDMLTDLEDNIKPDRTDLDLLFGCLLDWGLPISLPYTSEQIENYTVHTYNEGDLIACFDENIPESVIKEIAKRKPMRAVFRDAGFGSSPEKINVTEIFKMLAPDTDIKVI